MAKRVGIINFKGGVGKTMLAFHIAAGIARYDLPPVVVSLSKLELLAWELAVLSQELVVGIREHCAVYQIVKSAQKTIMWPLAVEESLIRGDSAKVLVKALAFIQHGPSFRIKGKTFEKTFALVYWGD